jgi:adenylosuccinate synthase
MKVLAVIGSGWGDEGKGAAVDALAAANPDALVVRFNGSAQAGHTIVTSDNKRHIFSHFCSGALAGTPGHLSEYFVVNPRIFVKEREELITLGGANLNLTVDPKTLVTTPLDVAFNRAVEIKRGADKHGSVGIGFGETIERSERGYPIYAGDLIERDKLRKKIATIMIEWAPFRKAELNVDLKDPIWWNGFYQKCFTFQSETSVMSLKEAAEIHPTIIFEGAQGLLLDQKRGMTFPYVTRSNTGLQNVVPLMNQLGTKDIQVIYMMRPYLTRHGAGPLPGEVEKIPGIEVIDHTNKDGPWQGKLRLAPFDIDLILNAIDTDIKEAGNLNIDPYIGISCMDQIKDENIKRKLPLKYSLALTGHGPRRDQYRILNNFSRKAA